MTYTVKQMENAIEEVKREEGEFRSDRSTGDPVRNLSHLRAANALAGAITIIAELAGRLSAAEELLAEARRPESKRRYRAGEEN